MIKLELILLIIMFLFCAFPQQVHSDSEERFEILLTETGELVLSDEHIEAYYWDTHEIELNKKGIKKWNTYMTYESIPKLAETLYNKDFVIVIGNKEMYRGKFWSMVSSAIPDCITITESLMKLDDIHNIIKIRLDFGLQDDIEKDPRDNPIILKFFNEKELLRLR